MKKPKKKTSIEKQYTRDGKTLKVLFNPDGDCIITIQSTDNEMSFEIPEPLTDPFRLMFWENYRRHHVWKTKAQKKVEKLLEHVQPTQDISIMEDITFSLDLDINYLPDLIELGK